MNSTIKADLYRYGGLTGTKGFLKGLRTPGFRYTWLLRKTASSKAPLRWFYSLLKRRYYFRYQFQIPTNTKIGEGLYIGHFGRLIINEEAIIGKYCNLAAGVTIGEARRGSRKGSPIIGDYVWIGIGAVVVGKITIGSNVLIAPNAYVNTDVPPNSIVMGNPARIISKENACEGYIEYILNPGN